MKERRPPRYPRGRPEGRASRDKSTCPEAKRLLGFLWVTLEVAFEFGIPSKGTLEFYSKVPLNEGYVGSYTRVPFKVPSKILLGF